MMPEWRIIDSIQTKQEKAVIGSDATERRTVFVVYTNSDCTEGRGWDIPIAVCAAEATALRLAKHQYVQGTDGPVRKMELVKIYGQWYAPGSAINVIEPSKEDKETQVASDARKAVLKKAMDAGLTDEEIKLLMKQA